MASTAVSESTSNRFERLVARALADGLAREERDPVKVEGAKKGRVSSMNEALLHAGAVLDSASRIFDPKDDRSLHVSCRAASLAIERYMETVGKGWKRPDGPHLTMRTVNLLRDVQKACEERRLSEFAQVVARASDRCMEHTRVERQVRESRGVER